jgi:hypothetical protein
VDLALLGIAQDDVDDRQQDEGDRRQSDMATLLDQLKPDGE